MPATADIEPSVYLSMGLTESEFAKLRTLVGRTPTLTEIGMFAVMWSEHCGYKFSRPVLAAFAEYKKSMEGEGLENAGVVPIGGGWGITMKVESHNHPSAVEPYQGAATGVGGIIRDILTMGARPIALLNSLRFGPINEGEAPAKVVAQNRHLLEHVVAGIAGYGNCVGVPTVGGEVSFHPRYSGNPLVNAMCVGLLRLDEVTTAAAQGIGNPVLYLGSTTGRDGIHGATFASEALDEESDAKRPNVQIGDPFAEKSLIEATLEALATGAIVAIQDMGAAGLTCSTIEMASKGDVGMDIDLDTVPVRDETMGAYEMMLSESQERMLAVADKGREQEVIAVFEKWGLPAKVIGYVTEEPRVRVTRHGKVEAELNPKWLTDECPVYDSPAEPGEAFLKAAEFDPSALPEVDLREALLKLLAHPDVASKRLVYEQYDRHVMTQTVLDTARGDAAVVHPDGTEAGIALSIDGNARWTLAHPRRGGRLAVAEAARNVACSGGKPIAATDGLNFGNPQHPHVFFGFREAVYGLAEACEALGTPVISGNVSFYNESDLGEVPPTPLVGMLGLMEDWRSVRSSVPQAGWKLFRISAPHGASEHGGIGASLFLQTSHGREDGYPVDVDLAAEKSLIEALLAIDSSDIAYHDESDGGFAVALAEMAMLGEVGARVELSGTDSAAELFGEFPSRVLIAAPEAPKVPEGLILESLGEFTSSADLTISVSDETLRWTLSELRDRYESALSADLFATPLVHEGG